MPFHITYSGSQKCKKPTIFPLGMDIHPPGSGWPERKVLWDSPWIFTGFWALSFGFLGLGLFLMVLLDPHNFPLNVELWNSQPVERPGGLNLSDNMS